MRGRSYAICVLATLVCGCAGMTPVSPREADRKLSATIERELPPLLAAGDYWRASKASFQLAAAQSRLRQTRAACAALANSLKYYRRALAHDTDTLLSVLDEFDGPGHEDAMTEIRSEFGCAGNRSAERHRPALANPQASEPLIPFSQQG